MNLYDCIGYLGAFFLTITFIPQTYSLLKTNEYSQIKYIFLWNTLFTSLCMNVYGYHYSKIPIMIGNTSVFLNSVIIMVFKYKHEHEHNSISNVIEL